MTTVGASQALMKAEFRLGESVSKPIISLMEIVDKGAEIWLSMG